MNSTEAWPQAPIVPSPYQNPEYAAADDVFHIDRKWTRKTNVRRQQDAANLTDKNTKNCTYYSV